MLAVWCVSQKKKAWNARKSDPQVCPHAENAAQKLRYSKKNDAVKNMVFPFSIKCASAYEQI